MSQVVDAGRTGDQRRQIRGPGGCKWEPQLHAAAAPACTQLHSLQNSLQNLPRFLRLLVCACSQPGTGCAAWPFPIPFCYPYIDLIAAPASLICPKSTPLASIIAAFSNPSYTRSVGAAPATPLRLIMPPPPCSKLKQLCPCFEQRNLKRDRDAFTTESGGTVLGNRRRQRGPRGRNGCVEGRCAACSCCLFDLCEAQLPKKHVL